MRYLLSIVAAIAVMLCLPAAAQTTYPGTLEELKAEVVRRAELKQYPVVVYDPEVVRGGAELLQGTTEDDWANAWIPIADGYNADAGQHEARDERELAMEDYLTAYRYYTLGRWPTPTSARKRESYDRSLQAFFAWDRLTELPTEVLEHQVGDESIVGLLRMPENTSQPVPLFVALGGLDGYKENAAMGPSLSFARQGIATLSLDAPGTVQTVRASTTAWRHLMEVIDEVIARPDIDASRVVLRGVSWGAYWSSQLAHRYADRFIGVVSHGPAIHGAFAAEWVQHVVDVREYFFDWRVALSYAFGTDDPSELESLMPPMSLETQGVLDNPTPPMLLVNGYRDEVWPIEDTFLLLERGTPKQAWVNPQGIHMGRDSDVWDSGRIEAEVIGPWILQRFELAAR